MTDTTEIVGILEELIQAMHTQTAELEKLAIQDERHAGPMTSKPQFSVVLSELSALQIRIAKLAQGVST
jgi:hypothetical protein